MATLGQQTEDLDTLARARQQVIASRAGDISQTPAMAEEINRQLNEGQVGLDELSHADPPEDVAADGGLSGLTGIGRDADQSINDMWVPEPPPAYDEDIATQRIQAIADLYYLYQHERIGIFRICKKLQELFRAGAVRLSDGDGARRLYQYDRREVLRYTVRDRLTAYRRAFGYGSIAVGPGTTPNVDFHRLFSHFNNQVALFWRDKRISDVIRERALDPSFGSIAIVRRSGLDLRNNLKFTSFGHINVMRVELMQLLTEAFRILAAPDVCNLFGVGVGNAWDVVDEVLVRYFNERLTTSPRQRMGVTGRQVLQWLAQPFILTPDRIPFEGALIQVAEPAEEWLTSAQSLNLAPRVETNRVLPWDAARSAPPAQAARRMPPRRPAPSRRPPGGNRPKGTNGTDGSNGAPRRRQRESENEW